MNPDGIQQPVSFVGHPFAAIGKGEEMRSNLRALLSLEEPIEVLDIYRAAPRNDPEHIALVSPLETRRLSNGTRIFHINGDEIEPVLEHLAAIGSKFAAGRNIVVPAWELPLYPTVWIDALKRFDEVWAISRFVQDSLASNGIEAHYIGQSIDITVRPYLSRRYFGVRDSAFLFLAFLDFSSYSARKNPDAVVEMFRRVLTDRPFDDIQLVLKIKGDEVAEKELVSRIDLPKHAFVLLTRVFSSHEQHSLIAACDCLVSLHRAEGFGRGPGEAMRMGRLALATGWSGNVDFMDDKNSLLVRYNLVPVESGQYSYWEGQVWAEPDVEHATSLAKHAIDSPGDVRNRARRGFDTVVRCMSNYAVGLRQLDRLNAHR